MNAFVGFRSPDKDARPSMPEKRSFLAGRPHPVSHPARNKNCWHKYARHFLQTRVSLSHGKRKNCCYHRRKQRSGQGDGNGFRAFGPYRYWMRPVPAGNPGPAEHIGRSSFIIDTEMLRGCFGGSASNYPSPEKWAATAVPFLLKLGPSDNGHPLTAP